ncbi:hypothetical protein LTR39_001569 [Cryomyces antarcticus]|nr:hypothetical protein LTR39_001569 [Cryomyces antarcticus]
MGGAAGGSLCMWFIGAYIAITDPASHTKNSQLSGAGIAAIFFFYLWTAFYTPSWNGTPWVLNSEMFDSNTRSLGQASAACNNWFWNFIVSRFTPQMFLTMGKSGCETKSIPLESMDRLFEIKPISRANKTVLAEVRALEEEFRHDADGAGLSVAKEKAMGHVENIDEV